MKVMKASPIQRLPVELHSQIVSHLTAWQDVSSYCLANCTENFGCPSFIKPAIRNNQLWQPVELAYRTYAPQFSHKQLDALFSSKGIFVAEGRPPLTRERLGLKWWMLLKVINCAAFCLFAPTETVAGLQAKANGAKQAHRLLGQETKMLSTTAQKSLRIHALRATVEAHTSLAAYIGCIGAAVFFSYYCALQLPVSSLALRSTLGAAMGGTLWYSLWSLFSLCDYFTRKPPTPQFLPPNGAFFPGRASSASKQSDPSRWITAITTLTFQQLLADRAFHDYLNLVSTAMHKEELAGPVREAVSPSL